MPRQIKGIASCLGPPIEELALPLNAPEGAQVAMRTRDQVVVKNRVELTHRPPVRMLLRWNAESCPIVIPYPFSQLGRQPVKDGVHISVQVGPITHSPSECGTSPTPPTASKKDYPRLPLFDPNAPATKCRYLNEVFLLVLDDLPTGRSMNTYAVDNAAQMQLLASAEH